MVALVHNGKEVGERQLVPRTDDAADNRRRLRQSYDAGDVVFVIKRADGGTQAIVSSRSNPGAWHHVTPGVGCDCMGFAHYATCRHYVRVMWIKRNGWNPYAAAPQDEEGS